MHNLDFRNQTLAELTAFFTDHGYNEVKLNNFKKAFRSQPVKKLAALAGIKGFTTLAHTLPFTPLELVQTSKDPEGNEKFVFKTHDQLFLESVFMPARGEDDKEDLQTGRGSQGRKNCKACESSQAGQSSQASQARRNNRMLQAHKVTKKTNSICVSVQVGCPLNCRFCTTGKLGFKRDLWAHEIIEQVRQIYQQRIQPARLSCISFMGMGEPLANLNNCMLAVDWLSSNWGWEVSREKITFSTSGAIPLTEFLAYPRLPNLALSLHTAEEEKRRWLMPACRLPLQQLKEYLSAYFAKTKMQPTIEYILFKDLNDSPAAAQALADYLQGLSSKVNLLNYNKPPCQPASMPGTNTSESAILATGQTEYSLEPVSLEKLEEFKAVLSARDISVLYRKSLGVGIGAGCGQLGQAFY